MIRIRFSLEVAQEPIHGRRKTEKDRRPLAHCPIVRMRMMDCNMRPTGEWDQEVVGIGFVRLRPMRWRKIANRDPISARIEGSTQLTSSALPIYAHPTTPKLQLHSPRIFQILLHQLLHTDSPKYFVRLPNLPSGQIHRILPRAFEKSFRS